MHIRSFEEFLKAHIFGAVPDGVRNPVYREAASVVVSPLPFPNSYLIPHDLCDLVHPLLILEPRVGPGDLPCGARANRDRGHGRLGRFRVRRPRQTGTCSLAPLQ